MKKKAICLILTFLFVFSGSMPAYAAVSGSVLEGCIPLTESEMDMFCEAVGCEDGLERSEEDILPYDLRHCVYAVQTAVYPIAVNTDTKKGVYNTGIGRSITYTTYYQMAALMLSNEETLQLMEEMYNYVTTLEGEYKLAGWLVYTKIFFQAAYPKSATITPSETCLSNPGQVSLSIPYQQSTYEISRVFGYPADKNPFEDFYTIGFDGMFTFKDTANGAERSLPFSSDVMFNKPN